MEVTRKPLHFVGSSHDDLKAFPDEARRDATGAFRVIYLAMRPEAVYVLHCFQKKTRKTRKADIDLAAHRFDQIGN
jgi:phage-related protein